MLRLDFQNRKAGSVKGSEAGERSWKSSRRASRVQTGRGLHRGPRQQWLGEMAKGAGSYGFVLRAERISWISCFIWLIARSDAGKGCTEEEKRFSQFPVWTGLGDV